MARLNPEFGHGANARLPASAWPSAAAPRVQQPTSAGVLRVTVQAQLDPGAGDCWALPIAI
jgi:hypothetical protein